MRFTKFFVVAAIAFSITSCGAVNYMTDKMEATELITQDLAQHGWSDARVGWQMNNGREFVSVQLDPEDVRSENFGELEQVVQATVVKHFKNEPDSLVISIAIEQEE